MRPSSSAALALALVALSSAALAAVPPAPPQPPPRPPVPTLVVAGGDVGRPELLGVRSADVDVRIVGHLAETRLTLTFSNPHDRALAGDLTVPLPEGATISGYALDVDGQLVDGVVVDKDEARRVFEIEVRKGVDPGLVEWVGGNAFRTRVFPIPARGSRTVAVRWVSEVGSQPGGARYELPLRLPDPIADLHIRLEVVRALAAPVVVGAGPLAPAFGRWRDSWVAEARLKAAALDRDLVVELPAAGARPVQVERAPDGRTFFLVRHGAAAPATLSAPAITRVRLLWDASRSREAADHAREIALVDRWLATLGAVTVDLVALRNDADPAITFSLPQDRARLVAALGALPYDGATTLAAAALPKAAPAPSVTVFVTDGVHTLGDAEPGDLRSPLFVLNGAPVANHDLLRLFAKQTGGAYLNLARLDDAAVLARLGRPVFSLLAARVTAGRVSDLYPRLPEPAAGPVALAGVLDGAEATLALDFGFPGRVTHTETFTVRAADAADGDLLVRFWAEQQVRELSARPEAHADALRALGRTYGIVTPGTSLLVLERLEQYLEHGVRPPATRADMRTAWDQAMAARTQEATAAKQTKLERVLEMWKGQVAWWEAKYVYPKDFRFGQAAEKSAESVSDGMGMAGVGSGGGGAGFGHAAARISSADMEAGAAAPSPEAREEAAKKKDGPDAEAGPEAAVALTKWDPDTPYLRALKAAPAAKRYALYLEQRAEYGRSPAFFLDCADFFAPQDARLGLRVLSNIAELELEDPALLRVLAHRLAQLEHLDLAALVFDDVRRLRPEEPQSHRDLALVLARRAQGAAGPAEARADWERALSLLATVVMGTWDRFDQIELIALTELNAYWPRARAAGASAFPLDPRLERRLDLDVRIVMTWDADMTDMDLHVVEPSTEEAYYSHNLTTIGGQVSRDFTQGYGPEVYSLRKAMHGTYKVKSKFFGSSAADLIGAVTLQVDVFTNYGRENEKRRSMTFRLTEKKEEFVIGEIEL